MWWELLKTLLVLIGVLGLIIVLAYAVRKYAPAGMRMEGGTEGWRILAVKALGPKRQIYLLEVGTRVLVVGVTDRSMSTLAEVTDAHDRELILAATARKASLRFGDFLKRAET